MILESVLIPITLLALLIASYTDIQRREVPDWVNYALIFTALGIRGIISIDQGWTVLLSGFLGLALCYGFAAVLYYTNQWGGGDSKLLMGMGAVIGIQVPFTISSLGLGGYIADLLILGAVYGLLWMGFLALQHWGSFWKSGSMFLNRYGSLHKGILVYTVLFLLLALRFPFLWPLTLFPLAVFYLAMFMTTVEDSIFLKKKSVSDLTEGDWLAGDVAVNGKIILQKTTLELKDLGVLRKLHRERKVSRVLIKEGIPFVPSFLLAYLVYLGGPAIWMWVAGLLFG